MDIRLRPGVLFGAALGVLAFARCGGTTAPGGGSDASVDGGSSSGSSSGGGGGGSGSGGGGGSGSGGGGGSSSGGGSGSGSGGASSSSSGGGAACGTGPACAVGRLCCGGQCVDANNDPFHCGTCPVVCSGKTPTCESGACVAPLCVGGPTCTGGTCCGTQCCTAGQLCCQMDGPVQVLQCFTPTATQTTCPQGCSPGCVSDRNLKRELSPVDPQAVLESVARIPVSTWSYTSDDPSLRHMGPMAQDFYAEFGLGGTDKAYSPIDAHGAAFAAIQGLYERVQAQQERLEKLERENAELRRRAGR